MYLLGLSLEGWEVATSLRKEKQEERPGYR